jgi:cbb3-type cytochrome oxidase subunit 3
MFSQGQLLFAVLFFITFVSAMVYAYRKDSKLHTLFYKGNYKILIAFLVFIGILFFIKIVFKR